MYAPAEAVPGRPTAWAKSMIDVFSASDEVAMVRFRLHLHEPLAFKTIVLESEHTHTGRLKPLYITNALSAEEKARYNVQLINVPFGDALLRKANCSLRRCVLALEDAQRRYQRQFDAIGGAPRAYPCRTPRVTGAPERRGRITRSRRHPRAQHAGLPHTRSTNDAVRRAVLDLRGLGAVHHFQRNEPMVPGKTQTFPVVAAACQGPDAVGMPATARLEWLAYDLLHGYGTPAREASHVFPFYGGVCSSYQAKDPSATMEKRVRTCTSVHGRTYGAHIASYDGKLPHVMGWPRHVLAPRASSIIVAQLLAENTTHAVSLLAEEAKAARVATAPSDQHWLVESNLRKARGRLAATMAELRLRGLSTAAPPTNQPPSVRAGRTDTDTR